MCRAMPLLAAAWMLLSVCTCAQRHDSATGITLESITVATPANLPPCNRGREGDVMYATSDMRLYACVEGAWRTVPGGPMGHNAMVRVVTLPEDAVPCPSGGLRIESGVDLNDDQVLAANEVQANVNLCHGENGQDGADGQDGEQGPAGPPGAPAQCSASTSTSGVASIMCSDGSTATLNDVDNDGVPDGVDTCPRIANPAQGSECCTGDSDCDDGDECTVDTCDQGECTHPAPMQATCDDLSNLECAAELEIIAEHTTLCLPPQAVSGAVDTVLCDGSFCADGTAEGCKVDVQLDTLDIVQTTDALGVTTLVEHASLSGSALGTVTLSVSGVAVTCALMVAADRGVLALTLRSAPEQCSYGPLQPVSVEFANFDINVELAGGPLCQVGNLVEDSVSESLTPFIVNAISTAALTRLNDLAETHHCALCAGYCDGALACGAAP